MKIDNDDQTRGLSLHQGVNNLTLAAKGSEQQNNITDQSMGQDIPLAASTVNVNKAADLDTIVALLWDTHIIAREWVDSASEWIKWWNIHRGFLTPTQIAQLNIYMYTSSVTVEIFEQTLRQQKKDKSLRL